MPSTTKDEQHRQRLRDYEAELVNSRASVAVLMQFVRGREARSGGGLLEEAFAAAPVEDGEPCPAAVWVTLRQGDLDATLETLARLSKKDFVIDEREELDSHYRLTTVEERQPLPDVEVLQRQLATFLRIPYDVVAVIASWGPDDPRTGSEIASLLEQRFGPVADGSSVVSAEPAAVSEPAPDTAVADVVSAEIATEGSGGLTLSSTEFTALLQLTPEQGAILHALVRQTAITIGSTAPGSGPGS